ncbi:MAG TPA: hypothetical protein VGV85_06240 [Longimicrobiaceae bacterium]|nr:hypothetical protein [Longimicrobiaceae bacterium]
MENHERTEELRWRIRDSARRYGDPLPREMALAWHGYLAAALEWGLVSPAQHQALSAMLPRPPGDFVTGILLGWEQGDRGDAAEARSIQGDW